MVKTQVQIPDHLYNNAKRISKEYEMSFAEVVRRGLEQIAPFFPPKGKSREKWEPPTPRHLGSIKLTDAEIKEQAQITRLEEELMEQAKIKRK